MEHVSNISEKPSAADLQLGLIKQNYGEKNTADLIAIFSAKNPELTAEEVIKVIYDTEIADLLGSTDWPDTTLDRVLIFR